MTVMKAGKPSRSFADKDKLLKMMREPGTGEVKRVNANIPVKLHNDLKIYSAMDKKEIREVLIDIIRDYVKTARGRHARKLRDLREELENNLGDDPSQNP